MHGLEYMAVVTIGEEVKVMINKSGTFEKLEGWFISHSSFFFSVIDKNGIWKNRRDKEEVFIWKKRQL